METSKLSLSLSLSNSWFPIAFFIRLFVGKAFPNFRFALYLALSMVFLWASHPLLYAQTSAESQRTSRTRSGVSNILLPDQGIRRIKKLYRSTEIVNFSDLPVVYDNGVLFTFYGEDKDEVFVSGTFYNWQKQLKMQKGQFGIYYAFLEKNLLPGSYSYRFRVNGLWQNDEAQSLIRFDKSFRKVSYFTLVEPVHHQKVSPVYLGEKVFRFYLEDKGYSSATWIASANRLDPRVSPMRLQGKYWVIERRVEPEMTFYAYHVDGQLMLDPKNPYTSSTPFHMQLNYIPIHFFEMDK